MDLFGAAARTMHLHLINPSLVTPEARIIQALVEQHVDDVTPEFFILNTANRLKDFSKSHFTGVIAQGLSYLYMLSEGYVWSDHFENQTPRGNAAASKSPDFVFAGPPGIALAESKGTLRSTRKGVDATAATGYRKQIEPHLGHTVGSGTANHGFAVGAWLKPPAAGTTVPPGSPTEIFVHHTAVPVATKPNTGAPAAGSAPTSLQLGNYAIAFALAFNGDLGNAIRHRTVREPVPMMHVKWLSREWVTGFGLWPFPVPLMLYPYAPFEKLPAFMIDKRIAETVLTFAANDVDGILDLEPLPTALSEEARKSEGAVFPDGLAVIRHAEALQEWQTTVWTPPSQRGRGV